MSFEVQFFIMAIVFTGVGWYFGCEWMAKRMAQLTVDALIDDGYLKYRLDNNGEVEIMKWNEEYPGE